MQQCDDRVIVPRVLRGTLVFVMDLLFLAPYPPCPPHSGGMLRIYNLLMGLARQHQVTCLTLVPNAAAVATLEPLRAAGRVVTVWDVPRRSMLQRTWTTLSSPLPDLALRFHSPTYAAALRFLLHRQQFDIIQAESLEMAQYGLLAQPLCSAKVVLDQFNAEYVLQKRAAFTDLARLPRPRSTLAAAYSLVQWRKLALYEQHMLRRCDCTLAVSEEDRRALLRLEPRASIGLVPNGVDTAYFQRSLTTGDTTVSDIVFTGTLDFRPNVDAVLWFASEVLPLLRAHHPAVRFVIVGRSPTPAVRALHNGERVVVQPDVPDVRPFIAASAVYIVPMRIGGGVRLKLLEALAMEAAVVSTTMGAEGVPELSDGEHLLLADTPREFAGAIARLLDDPALRLWMGAAGRVMVAANYDWHVIVPRLEDVYRSLC